VLDTVAYLNIRGGTGVTLNRTGASNDTLIINSTGGQTIELDGDTVDASSTFDWNNSFLTNAFKLDADTVVTSGGTILDELDLTDVSVVDRPTEKKVLASRYAGKRGRCEYVCPRWRGAVRGEELARVAGLRREKCRKNVERRRRRRFDRDVDVRHGVSV
jgi:hypothetical protein